MIMECNVMDNDNVTLVIYGMIFTYWYLVGGLEHKLYFPYIGNVTIPTGDNIFQRGRYTTNQM